MFSYTLFWLWWQWWCWYDGSDNIRPQFKGAGFCGSSQDDAFASVRLPWRFATEEFLAWTYLNSNGMWQWNIWSMTHFFFEVWACGMWYLWLCMTMGDWGSVQIGLYDLYVSSEIDGQPRTKIQQASFCAPFRVVWKESKLQASFIFFYWIPDSKMLMYENKTQRFWQLHHCLDTSTNWSHTYFFYTVSESAIST